MEARIKKTFICANVQDYRIDSELTKYYVPAVGDVAVFEVKSLGKHLTIQGESEKLVKIMPGDYIMAAFGHRYATEQFEGYVPTQCRQDFHILGAGGTIGIVESTHARFAGGPTKLQIVGYVTNQRDEVINTKTLEAERMLAFTGRAAAATKVILSIGSSMDSGKTTTAAHLVHGLSKQGKNVVFIKLTGTVYTKDRDLSYDLGAVNVLDFSEYGYPSTYMCDEDELLNLYESLVAKALDSDPDYVIMEIADGIYQRETQMLLRNRRFMATIHDVIFSACDSLSAVCGIETLRKWNIKPFGLCGMFTTSPLLMKEVKSICDTPIFTLDTLHKEAPEMLIKNAGDFALDKAIWVFKTPAQYGNVA
jgi:hypothetical protein